MFRHATTRKNLTAIQASGKLDPELAKGKLKEVWLHTPSKTPWAILHVQARHNVLVDDVVIIDIRLDKENTALTRRKSGLWSFSKEILVERIIKVREAKEFYASPIISDRTPEEKLLNAIFNQGD